MLGELDTHAAGVEDEHRLRFGGLDLTDLRLIVELAERGLGTPVAAAGISMGGFGALVYARRRRELGDPLRTAPVTTELVTAKNGAQEVRLTPQPGFLADPATTYPVTIDPSTHLGRLNDHWVSKDMRSGATATYNSYARPKRKSAGSCR